MANWLTKERSLERDPWKVSGLVVLMFLDEVDLREREEVVGDVSKAVILDCNSSIRANKEVASVDWLLVDDIVRARTEARWMEMN